MRLIKLRARFIKLVMGVIALIPCEGAMGRESNVPEVGNLPRVDPDSPRPSMTDRRAAFSGAEIRRLGKGAVRILGAGRHADGDWPDTL